MIGARPGIAERLARATAGKTSAKAHLGEEHTPNLGEVLRGGRFEVDGSVYYNPLWPFDASGELPPAGERDYFSEEEIPLYRFPE